MQPPSVTQLQVTSPAPLANARGPQGCKVRLDAFTCFDTFLHIFMDCYAFLHVFTCFYECLGIFMIFTQFNAFLHIFMRFSCFSHFHMFLHVLCIFRHFS